MGNIKILLTLMKFIVIYLSSINCNAIDKDIVYWRKVSNKNEFQYSVNGWTYHMPKNITILSKIKEIQVTSNIDSNIIENYVFSNEFQSLKILKLDLPAKNISIKPYAFANLTNLEYIEINSAHVLLHVDTFKRMPKLQSLKLQIINSTTANLIAVLKNHPGLVNLELLNHYSVDICNYQSNDNPLQLLKLQYTGGHMKALSHGCFKCLKYLTELIITNSNLTTLIPGIFDGLDNLIKVSLVLNKQLTHIPPQVFNRKSLNTIDLSENSIKNIDNRAFNLIEDNKLSLLNMSYNQLEYIGWKMFDNIKCDLIDLSRNDIQFIGDNAFEDSRVDILFLFDNIIFNFQRYSLWGLENQTIVFFERRSDDILINFGENINVNYDVRSADYHCYLSQYNYFKICKTPNFTSLSLVLPIVPNKWQPNILEIKDDGISSIEENAFVNITIKTLIITSASKNFIINKKSFEGLSNLEQLKLNTQEITYDSYFLDYLKSLRTFEIAATDAERCNFYVCELIRHLNVKNLLISDAERIAICDKNLCTDRNTKITNLRYTDGWFTSLQKNDFVCLDELVYLEITTSSLKDIKPGSFNGLDKLTYLILFSNELTQIDQNTFEKLTKLNLMILRGNKINNIVDGAFRGKTLSTLDLSYNELTSISKDLFVDAIIKQLDLSNNKLKTIEFGSFKHLNFETINVGNNEELKGNITRLSANETLVQTKCFTQASFEICTKLNSLSSVNAVIRKYIDIMFLPDFLLPSKELELFDISSINKNAFAYSNFRSQFTTLTIHSNGYFKFTIYPESFRGLINLENLILNVGSIELKKNLFVELKSLKFLEIAVIETSQYLSQVLTDLNNLKTLQIVGNHSVGICQNSFSKDIPNSIIDIRYTTGTINRLQENSLICLPQIRVFTITKTQLTTIEAGAFNLLTNLRYINLSYNKISLVSFNVFNNLENLAVLLLNNNEIENIDDEAFMLFDNENFVMYNLSHNELTSIKRNIFDGIKSDQLDLTYNKISSIESGAFTDSNIKDLYLFSNPDIHEVKKAWNISIFTIVHMKLRLFFNMYCLSKPKMQMVRSCEACSSMCVPLNLRHVPRLG